MVLWDKQAKRWANIGPPLRPSQADIHASVSWLNHKSHSDEKPLSVLLLGVTPEIVNIAWPKNTKFIAIDNNIVMLQSILPRQSPTIKPLAIAGNWLDLPLADSSIDVVIGDGCYTLLANENYQKMTTEIRRVVTPAGTFIMRFFIRPACNESLEVIQNDLHSGKIANFNILKWRIAMALHGALHEGVCLRKIWDSWDRHFKKNNQAIFKKLQWPKCVIETIDNYKNSDVYYSFPTIQEVRATLHSYFKEQDIFLPCYPLGERCPTLKLAPI